MTALPPRIGLPASAPLPARKALPAIAARGSPLPARKALPAIAARGSPLPIRKGLVFTVAIFMLAAVLLQLLAFAFEQGQRLRADLSVPDDAETIFHRLDELSWVSRQALGFNATTYRNNTRLELNISDKGFPLVPSASGYLLATPLEKWLQSNWTNATNASLRFNVSLINNSGLLLLGSDGLNYSHNNTNAVRDAANLTIAGNGNFTPKNLTVDIACSWPAATSTITYTDLSAAGASMDAKINFNDGFAGQHASSDTFDYGNNNVFAANYTDALGLWLQTIHLDWVRPNYTLLIWEESNATYPVVKGGISCRWNVSLVMFYNNNTNFSLYLPANVSLAYGNASYAGWLPLARK